MALENDTKPSKLPDLYEASIPELQNGLNAGLFSSVDLVKVRRLYILLLLSILMKFIVIGISCPD